MPNPEQEQEHEPEHKQPPPPPISTSAKPIAVDDSEAWRKVAAVFRKVGVNADAQAAREFKQFGYQPEQAPELCSELEKRPDLGPGALVERIRKVSPDRPLSEGWPPPAKATTKSVVDDEARQRSTEQLAAIDANAAKAKAESQRAEQLESEVCDDMDNASFDELLELIPKAAGHEKHKTTLRESGWRKLPAMVRRKLVTAFAHSRDPVNTTSESGHDGTSIRRKSDSSNPSPSGSA